MKLRGILKHTLWLLPALSAVGLYFGLPHFPWVAEWVCARGVFRVVNTVLSTATGLLPFSLTELAVTLAVPALLILLTLFVVRLCRCVHKGRFLAAVGRGLGWTLSCTALLYMFTHGCNFYRYSTAELMEMDTTTCTPEYLQAVVIDLAEKVSAAREEITVDSQGYMTLSEPLALTLARADDGYRALSAQYPFLWGASYRTKAVKLSYWWSYTGIAGMYFSPFRGIQRERGPARLRYSRHRRPRNGSFPGLCSGGRVQFLRLFKLYRQPLGGLPLFRLPLRLRLLCQRSLRLRRGYVARGAGSSVGGGSTRPVPARGVLGSVRGGGGGSLHIGKQQLHHLPGG